MENYAISISVVAYNNEKCIGPLIDSILEHTQQISYNIYIIDNHSTDQTARIVESRLDPRIVYIQNQKNIGFGAGHNRILDRIDTKYHFIVNPDILIKDNVLLRISRYLDAHPDVGALTPKICYPDGRLQRLPKKDPRLIYTISRRVHLGFLRRYRDEYEMLSQGADNIYDIEFCTGSFMALRTDLYKMVGGFDERYFLYFEDADLTREIRKYARALYNPDFVVYHHWERAGSKEARYFFIQVQSMLKYALKWRKSRQSQTTGNKEHL